MPPVAARFYSGLGAVAFCLSLGVGVYVYLTRLGAPSADSGQPWPSVAANAAMFTVFALHHSIMARSGAKRWLARRLPAELERSTYVWIASGLFALTCLLWQDLPGRVYAASGWLRVLGVALQLGGAVMTGWAVLLIDPLELAGIRQATAPVPERPAPPPALSVRGPYRWVRHPIYLGWALMVCGTPDMTMSRLSFAVITTAYLVVAIPWEERSMVEVLGNEYRRYRDRVRWRMVPWVY